MELNTLQSHLISLEQMLVSPDYRHDVDVLNNLIDKDFIEVGASGRRFGYEEVVERLPQEAPMQCIQSNFECRLLGENIAQLCYQAIILTPEKNLESRRTSIWRFNESLKQWQMIYHQGTNTTNY